MGTFAYGSPEELCGVADHTLLHLQIVIVAKLRLGDRAASRTRAAARGDFTV